MAPKMAVRTTPAMGSIQFHMLKPGWFTTSSEYLAPYFDIERTCCLSRLAQLKMGRQARYVWTVKQGAEEHKGSVARRAALAPLGRWIPTDWPCVGVVRAYAHHAIRIVIARDDKDAICGSN